MTTEQLVEKYGVPMPETCKKLNLQGKPNFVWVREWSCDYMGQPCILGHEKWEIYQTKDLTEEMMLGGICEIVEAPQSHEIAKEISKYVDTAEDLAQWYLTEKQAEQI